MMPRLRPSGTHQAKLKGGVEAGSYATAEGVSLLEAKVQLMLQYNITLGLVALLKLEGKPLGGHPLVGEFRPRQMRWWGTLHARMTAAWRTQLMLNTRTGHLSEDRLCFLRTLLEKIRPIEAKLKYQLDRLVRVAVEGEGAESGGDLLRHKPRAQNLLPKQGQRCGRAGQCSVVLMRLRVATVEQGVRVATRI